MEALLPGAQHRETGASRVRAVEEEGGSPRPEGGCAVCIENATVDGEKCPKTKMAQIKPAPFLCRKSGWKRVFLQRQRLRTVPPLRGGFQTSLGSLLYFAAISYFAGHEAGHHLAGHDGYYLSGAHAEAEDEGTGQSGATKITMQALEHQADRVGLTISRIVMMKLLSKLWEVRSFSDVEKREYQRILAILLSGGAMMAVVKIKPRDFDWADIPGRTHPPAVVRIISMATELSAAFKRNFDALDHVSRRWIRINCLELAVGATINSGTNEDRIYQDRLARGGEPAAIRAVGIRKALNDPRLKQYYGELERCLTAVRPQLRPRTKIVA